mmetsp:Transcript_63628/g.170441  ORF Transcript_63628/g.170441 Transcript_63628/m.170441 type:complete len:207 (-) Transcript_63628:381-1001(-)
MPCRFKARRDAKDACRMLSPGASSTTARFHCFSETLATEGITCTGPPISLATSLAILSTWSAEHLTEGQRVTCGSNEATEFCSASTAINCCVCAKTPLLTSGITHKEHFIDPVRISSKAVTALSTSASLRTRQTRCLESMEGCLATRKAICSGASRPRACSRACSTRADASMTTTATSQPISSSVCSSPGISLRDTLSTTSPDSRA